MMKVRFRGNFYEVNEYNPNFQHLTGENVPYIEVEAICKHKGEQETDSWTETFKVTSLESAIQEIEEVIKFFNETRNEYEKERELVIVLIGENSIDWGV